MPLASALNQDYLPINCTFHDRLEDYAIRSAVIPVRFMQDGRLVEADARILDVFAKDGADFAKLSVSDGPEILVRLDYLVSVNGFEMPTAC